MPNGYNAYTDVQGQQEDVRLTEARALLRCAGHMESVQAAGTPYADYVLAVKANQKLWDVLRAGLMDPDNQLPHDLKQLLKAISVNVERRTLRAYAEGKPELLNLLININKQIAGGLMDQMKNEGKSVPNINSTTELSGSVNVAG